MDDRSLLTPEGAAWFVRTLQQFLEPRYWCRICGDGYATLVSRDACEELHVARGEEDTDGHAD